jgi:BioD-like phosphotransacetylase family protein
MPTLLVASSAPLSGKTTVAVALARALARDGKSASLERAGDDANAASDRRVLSAAAAQGDTKIIELPAGDPATALKENAGARLIVVATPESASEALALAGSAGDALAGLILNRARVRGESGAGYEGLTPIASLPEDRVLASPSLAAVQGALEAEAMYVETNPGRTLDRLVIASIAADPGQAYFDRTRADSVIVRSDKPDLQLAALNAGAECLIVTGDLPVLSYVRDRVEEDEVPFLRTKLDTKGAVEAIERLYGVTPFSGDAEKLRRLDELFTDVDVSAIFAD